MSEALRPQGPSAELVPPDPHRGRKVGGKYQVLSQLSAGGMAEIFLAFTAGPGGFRKYVVVKQILPDVRSDDSFRKMFLDEARVTAQFAHPNIGQVFDLGEDEEGLYLAMEFIAGQNLNQISKATQRRSAVLPVGFSCAVARDVCNALHYAHTFTDPLGRAFPIIHRDVAQKNVMVTYTGTTKLLDFGIASSRGKLNRTSVGHVKGTTGYMSPEQTRGDPLDARSDLFSVGVMLHELVTGRRLFAGDTEEEEMRKILGAPIPRPGSINTALPEALDHVIMRALARERSDRYASAKELAKAIEQAAGKLLFDADQCAGFMKELFEGKMSATRALLETAETSDISQVHSAVMELREDEGLQFPASPVPTVNPNPGVSSKERVRETVAAAREADETVEREIIRNTAIDQAAEMPERKGMGVWLVGLFLAAAVGLFFVMRLTDKLDEHPPGVSENRIKKDENPLGLKPFDEPAPLPPGFQQQLPQVDKQAQQQPSAQDANKQDKPVEKVVQAPVKKSPMGALTLIILPGAEVFVGNTKLGKTPLLRHALPVGTHKLRIRGDDGKDRLLSAVIEKDKTSAMKLQLADLPEMK